MSLLRPLSRFFPLIIPALLLVFALTPPPVNASTTILPGAAVLPADFHIVLPWTEGVEHTITQTYGTGMHHGVNADCCTNEQYALDFDFATDEPVYPAAAATVVYAGPALGPWASFGNIVFLDHNNGFQSLYAHLNTINVTTGSSVTVGTALGGAGGTGGWLTHLHFAMYQNAKFYNTSLGTGHYGGASAVPEPFNACITSSGACDNLFPSMRVRKAGVAQAQVPAPAPAQLQLPTSSDGMTLNWNSPLGARAYELQVTPMNGDGPGLDMIVSDSAQVLASAFSIASPAQGNYLLLQGAHYSWRVRFVTGSVLEGLTVGSSSWSAWSSPQWFQMPIPQSNTISVQSPGATQDATPTIQWNDSNPEVFYYEVQLSRDPLFRTGSGSIASVYWNLVHGGVSSPHNSWTVPDNAALAPGAYFVRVRPRVQATPAGGAEQGVAWGSAVSFTVAP